MVPRCQDETFLSLNTIAELLAHGQALIAADLPEAVGTLLHPYLQGGRAPSPSGSCWHWPTAVRAGLRPYARYRR